MFWYIQDEVLIHSSPRGPSSGGICMFEATSDTIVISRQGEGYVIGFVAMTLIDQAIIQNVGTEME